MRRPSAWLTGAIGPVIGVVAVALVLPRVSPYWAIAATIFAVLSAVLFALQRRVKKEEAPSLKDAVKRTDSAAFLREQLVLLLDSSNRRRLAEHQPLEVIGSEGGHYAIRFGYIQNVSTRESDGSNVRYCAHARQGGDTETEACLRTMIAQVLMITTDEPQFTRIAIKGYW